MCLGENRRGTMALKQRELVRGLVRPGPLRGLMWKAMECAVTSLALPWMQRWEPKVLGKLGEGEWCFAASL